MFSRSLDPHAELRPLELRHANDLFALVDANRDYLRKWLPWVDATRGPEDTAKFIQSRLDDFAANRGFEAGIWRDGRLAGVIGYHRIDWRNRNTSLGYWLAQNAQGHGIMTNACRAFIDHAFRELGLHRIEIRAAEKNERSRAIPERLGFRQEGVVRDAEFHQDHYLDLVIYGLTAAEWSK